VRNFPIVKLKISHAIKNAKGGNRAIRTALSSFVIAQKIKPVKTIVIGIDIKIAYNIASIPHPKEFVWLKHELENAEFITRKTK
jgi:hypothetical protein